MKYLVLFFMFTSVAYPEDKPCQPVKTQEQREKDREDCIDRALPIGRGINNIQIIDLCMELKGYKVE